MDLFAVSGKPVYHSKSPLIFNRHFQNRRKDARYLRYAARDAEDIISFIKDLNLTGMNVTAPFKQDIFSLLDNKDETAAAIGAVNTIARRQSDLYASCTDTEGVIRPLLRRTSLAGTNAVLVGAGGAARAALFALVRAGAHVTVVNRSFEKARLLADEFGAGAAPMSGEAIENLFASNRVIVHTLLHGAGLPVPPPLLPHHVVLDANYHDSIYIEAARRSGATLIPGEEWLYEQADAASTFMTGEAIDDLRTLELITSPRENTKSHIALTGFMGCGKTMVGGLLQDVFSMPLYDLDSMIEKEASLSITQIFAQFGETHFRDLESGMLARVLEMPRGVISCGGGIIERESSRELLNSAHTVWLYAPAGELYRRVCECGGSRPLAGTFPDFEMRYTRRIPLYAQCADLVISSAFEAKSIAVRIHDEISPFF